jgi:hypothetical protein
MILVSLKMASSTSGEPLLKKLKTKVRSELFAESPLTLSQVEG